MIKKNFFLYIFASCKLSNYEVLITLKEFLAMSFHSLLHHSLTSLSTCCYYIQEG